jgi:hypothetical protein
MRRVMIDEPMIGLACIAAARGDHEQARTLAHIAHTNEDHLHRDELIVHRRLTRRFLAGALDRSDDPGPR